MQRPATAYASTEAGEIAYQVLGDADRDILLLRAFGNVETQWDVAPQAAFLHGLARFGRLIVFDRRGSGASDPVPLDALPTWEEWADDALAVLDRVGSERAVIVGEIDAGPIALALAAAHPERVESLILLTTAAKYMADDDYEIGVPEATVDDFIALIARAWGTEELAALSIPSVAHDPELLASIARFVRTAATPRSAAAQYDYMFRRNDNRSALPLIQAPTLILHRTGTPFVPLALGRYMAEHIEGARLVEVPGHDLYFFVEDSADLVLGEIGAFVTGEVPVPDVERSLATVLFTDIVSSTERAASLGDSSWRELLDGHDAVVREEVARQRGRTIKSTGDGVLATFDGPARAIRCAASIRDRVAGLGLAIRAGLHAGEVELRGEDIAGIAVHIGARVNQAAAAGEILVSRTVADLVAGSSIEFEPRGEFDLKGVPGPWALYAVTAT